MYAKTVTTLSIIALILLASAGIPAVLADELTAPQPIVNASPVTLSLENHTYYPDDIVRFYVTGGVSPEATIVDPMNATYPVLLTGVDNGSFMGEYSLSQGIILGNYTVIAADNTTGTSVQDLFEVITHTVSITPTPVPNNTTVGPEPLPEPLYLYINLSKTDYLPGDKAVITIETNAGKPAIIIQDPANNTAYPACKATGDGTYSATYGLDKAVVLGNYTVLAYVNENGTYCSAMAGFNVTMGKRSDNNTMHIRYAAYDPVQKAVVLRANITSDATGAVSAVKSDPAVKGMSVKSVKVLDSSNATAAVKEDRKVDIVIPVDPNNVNTVVSQYNMNGNATKATTSVAVSADGKNIHISLNNKVDGSWYRLSASIPAGSQVIRITRADGTVISNDVRIDRNTGQTTGSDVNWYVDNGTLYFYDDPINGYDITLLPPMASNSLAVNVVNGGQLSAIVFPFNQTDSDATITANDHLGRNGDNNYANDIDADAGSKTAVRLYNTNQVSTANRRMFGNEGLRYPTYSNANYVYTDLGTPATIGFNTVPDGSVESVIISNYRTPVAGGVVSYVNITQKTIIRNNNLWFATVYYINNAGGADLSGFRFYQGSDFNFNGQYSDDDDFYNSANDSVYGYMDNQNANSIHVGGFSSPLSSSAHDVNQYGTIFTRISSDGLLNGTSTNGIDAGMALAWDRGTLKNGETWVVPVIWAVGKDTNSFGNTLNNAVDTNVYDVGIRSIDTPLYGDSLDSQTTPTVAINATAMDIGVTDQSPTVVLQIKNSAGTIVYNTSTTVTMSVPYKETAPATFSWNLSGVTSGMYNISVYTLLPGDQNSSNNLKSITVYVQDFSLSPDQWVHANPGDNVLFPLNLSNLGMQRKYNLSLSSSTAGWASNLYLTNTSTLIASDTNGDGVWDWVNASYINASSGLPAITVPSGGKTSLLLQKLVPATADTGILDIVTLTAYTGSPLTNSSAILRTDTPLGSMANKTFYLHSLTMNTSPEPAAGGSTAITSIFSMWSQAPAFADNFLITGNVSVPIYYTTTAAMPITVTLFYTDGRSGSVLIGSNTSTLAAQSTPAMFNFTIPAAGNVTVPRGSYLVLKIDNQQTTAFNVWYANAYRSRIDVKTPTYVHVSAINTFKGAAPATNFNPGDTVYVTGNVTDPIGAYDIAYAMISVTAPNGTYIVNNQTMLLNRTDTSNPALWKLYNYSFSLDNSLPAGVYGINVTGYESNGVINRKNVSVTLISNTPAVLIYPNSTKISAPNTVLSFKHSVTNLNAYQGDVVDITCAVPSGWAAASLYKSDGITPLTDTDSDGKPDTGTLSPLGSADIVIRVTVPSNVNLGSAYFLNATATSSQNVSVSSKATDTVLVSTTSVVKTLYLHDNGTQFMNTSMNSSAIDHTDINSGKNDTWVQSPAFARAFNILDDPGITLYAVSGDSSVNMSVSLISSNGTSSATIGSIAYNGTVTAKTPTVLSFNLSLATYNVTIPRGNQLSLYIVNLNDNTLTINQSPSTPSRIDMNTLSYINVQTVSITDLTGNAISGTTPPSTVKVVANVTDPFGTFDIRDVNVSIYDGSGTLAIGPISMNGSTTDTSALSMWKLFERNITLSNSLNTGIYSITVTANESNGVKSNLTAPLTISYPINVTASKACGTAGNNSFSVVITLKNNDNHTVTGVRAYDFYAGDFTVSGFSSPPTTISVNNAMLQGNVNAFGPYTLAPGQVATITYTAQGVGKYNLSNMTIIGVDPDA